VDKRIDAGQRIPHFGDGRGEHFFEEQAVEDFEALAGGCGLRERFGFRRELDGGEPFLFVERLSAGDDAIEIVR
jgi:hypothetical protein